MIEVYICQLPEEKNRVVLGKLLPHVSAERQDRIKRFIHINDAYRTLLGELLLRFILVRRYGSISKQLDFAKNLYGKPFLGQYPLFHYNIAHSGEWVVCAVHNQEIGVDVERILPFDLGIAKQFFTGEEYWTLLNAKEERAAVFYDLWTLKESYLKAQGRGLSIPLDSFSVKIHSSDSIELTDMKTRKTMTDYSCKQYRLNKQYRLSVCANHANLSDFEKLPMLVSFNNLCADFNSPLSG